MKQVIIACIIGICIFTYIVTYALINISVIADEAAKNTEIPKNYKED